MRSVYFRYFRSEFLGGLMGQTLFVALLSRQTAEKLRMKISEENGNFYVTHTCIHIYRGCLNIHATHVTTNDSTTNNVVFFLVSNLKKSIQ